MVIVFLIKIRYTKEKILGVMEFFMIVAENTRDLSHEMNWPHICCAKTYKYCTFALAYVKIHIGFSKRSL